MAYSDVESLRKQNRELQLKNEKLTVLEKNSIKKKKRRKNIEEILVFDLPLKKVLIILILPILIYCKSDNSIGKGK